MTPMLRLACILAPVLLFANAPQALAQSAGQHMFGIFLGATDRDDFDVTLGAEYEYLFTEQWTIGGLVEYTPDAYGNSSATLVMATANLRAIPRLKITGGAGVEFNTFDDRFRARIGAGYDVIEGPFNVTPRIAVDFGKGDENVVVGATVSRRF